MSLVSEKETQLFVHMGVYVTQRRNKNSISCLHLENILHWLVINGLILNEVNCLEEWEYVLQFLFISWLDKVRTTSVGNWRTSYRNKGPSLRSYYQSKWCLGGKGVNSLSSINVSGNTFCKDISQIFGILKRFCVSGHSVIDWARYKRL